jgi:hypothetical protein
MKKILYSIVVACAVVGINPSPTRAADNTLKAENKGNKSELDDRTQNVNQAAKKGGNMDAALRAISVETGVPMERVREMHQKHPDAGVGGVLNACVLADETKKGPEDFLKQHMNGKGWTGIATENHVSTDKMLVRLNRIENYLTSGANSTEYKKNKK